MKGKIQLLFIDDDRAFSPLVCEYLGNKGYETTLCHSGEEGLQTFRNGDFDLCILDIRMPFKDGFAVAREMRDLDPDIPFIFLSGELDKDKRIKGFQLGADDYVTKPFSLEELFLRIQAVLRRAGTRVSSNLESAEFKVGRYVFHTGSRELSFDGTTSKLSAIESNLLRYFCEAPHGIIDRQTALQKVWGDENHLRGRSLNVYVSKLRQLLKDDPGIEILNIHGEGYQLVVKPG